MVTTACTSSTSVPPSTVAHAFASQTADDDVEEGEDSVDDGVDDGGNGSENCHDHVTNGAENTRNLWHVSDGSLCVLE